MRDRVKAYNVLKFISNQMIIGENMITLNIHGRKIFLDASEIGIYRDWSKEMPLDYSVMNTEHFERVANSMPISKCVETSKKMHDEAEKQAGFNYGFQLPERVMDGILNTKKLMKNIIDELANVQPSPDYGTSRDPTPNTD